MAKTKGDKQESAAVELAEGALIDVPLDELLNPELTAIDGVLRQFGDVRSMMRVYRQGPGGYRDLVFLYECAPSEWLNDGPMRLQRDYGKGIYRLHLHNEAGQMVLNKSVPIEALPPRLLEKLNAAPVTTDGNSAVMAAMEKIGASMQLMAQAIAATQQRDPLAGLAGLKEIAGIVKDMMPPVLNPAPATQSMESTLSLLRTVMDVAKGFAPPTSPRDGDGNLDVQGVALNKGLDLISKLFEQRAALPVAAGEGVQVLSPEALAALPQPSGENMGIAETLEMQALKLQLRLANREAVKNSDPAVYADEIVELIPDDVFDMLESDPKWFEYVCGIVPECAPFKSWYDRLRTELLALTAPESPEEAARIAQALTPGEKASSVPAHGDTDAGTGAAERTGKSKGNASRDS